MRSARDYTTKQIKPLLQNQQEHLRAFLAADRPAYAATESFHYVQGKYPQYEYKEAALNPTNLRDRAVDWEADVINQLSQSRRREGAGRRARYADGPFAVSGQADLRRQALPGVPRPAATAPPALMRHYGSANGFGWKEAKSSARRSSRCPWRCRSTWPTWRFGICWFTWWRSSW